MPPNGVQVRGLLILRSHEQRRPRAWLGWLGVIAAVASDVPYEGPRDWTLMTVTDRSTRHVVARRRFEDDRTAEDARTRFAEAVNGMSDGADESADWQAVLDRL